MSFIDPVCVPDVFAEKLSSVEDLGGVLRFTFTTKFQCERTAVFRLIMPTLMVQDANILTQEALVRVAWKPLPLPDCCKH